MQSQWAAGREASLSGYKMSEILKPHIMANLKSIRVALENDKLQCLSFIWSISHGNWPTGSRTATK